MQRSVTATDAFRALAPSARGQERARALAGIDELQAMVGEPSPPKVETRDGCDARLNKRVAAAAAAAWKKEREQRKEQRVADAVMNCVIGCIFEGELDPGEKGRARKFASVLQPHAAVSSRWQTTT